MALNKLKKSNRYQYTCPDVIHYRKNQYRLAFYSNLLSYAYMAVFFGVLSSLNKHSDRKTLEPMEPNRPSNDS